MLDQFGCRIAACHFDQRRIGEKAIGQQFDLVGESGGEQQVLALLGQHCEDALDVADEAHVQHAVGFVQHQDLDVRQVHCLLLQVVEQTSRCRHQDIHAAMQLFDLRIDVDAAEHHHGFERQIFAVFAHALFHLGSEFARGREHQRADVSLACDWLGHETLQQRQCKTSGLAGAGLRTTHQVAALQNDGDSLRLNRCGFGITALGNGTDDFFGQAERFK